MQIVLCIIGLGCFSLFFWGLLENDTFKIVVGAVGVAACLAAFALQWA